jgi:hypothetical protein
MYPYYPYPYPIIRPHPYLYPIVTPYYGNYYSSNVIGSAISEQSLINTGNMFGVNQISTPTVIW